MQRVGPLTFVLILPLILFLWVPHTSYSHVGVLTLPLILLLNLILGAPSFAGLLYAKGGAVDFVCEFDFEVDSKRFAPLSKSVILRPLRPKDPDRPLKYFQRQPQPPHFSRGNPSRH